MLPGKVLQAYPPSESNRSTSQGSSLLPYSVHARDTGTLLIPQTDKGAWDRLSKLRVTESQMSNWFSLASSASTQAGPSFLPSFLHSFTHSFLCVLVFCVHVSARGCQIPLEVQSHSLSCHVGAGKYTQVLRKSSQSSFLAISANILSFSMSPFLAIFF